MTEGTAKLGSHGRERALVVEADRDQAEVAARLLRDAGYAVELAKNAGEALSTLTRVPAQLILVDCTSNEEPVIALLKGVRRMRDLREVPVLAAFDAGIVPGGFARRLGIHGVDVFVSKPYRGGDFLAAVAAITGRALPGAARVLARVSNPGQERAVTQPAAVAPSRLVGRPRAGVRAPAEDDVETVQTATIGEVDGSISFRGEEVPCVVEGASRTSLQLRCAGQTPELFERVRVHVALRLAVADSMESRPVRILGQVQRVGPPGPGQLIQVSVQAAGPEQNLHELIAYLGRG